MCIEVKGEEQLSLTRAIKEYFIKEILLSLPLKDVWKLKLERRKKGEFQDGRSSAMWR